jgi:hypothetical protein
MCYVALYIEPFSIIKNRLMGFFKRIFGIGKDNDSKRIEEVFSKINSGELNKIYPLFKPGNWVGIKYGVVKQVLLGTEENPELVIGYGYNGEKDFVFITHDMLQGKTLQDVYKESMDNIRAFDAPMKEVEPGKVIICDEGEFCSEKILHKAFMQEIQTRLNAKELLVSIPRRGNMMVISRQAEQDILSTFIHVHTKTWTEESTNAPITDTLFVVVDGNINGTIRLN